MTSGGGQSETDEATNQLDATASGWRRRFKFALASNLVLGVAAGFVALVPGRGGRLAAAFSMIGATTAVALIGYLRLEARWHETRDRVERMHSVKFRYRLAIDPYCDESARARVVKDLAALGMTRGPDPSWDVTRSLPIFDQVSWYRTHRLARQRAFYLARSVAFRRRERSARRAIFFCYMAVSLIAIAEVVTTWEVELVAPFAAVLAALQAWSATRRWGHTAQIYEGAIQTIDMADTHLAHHLLKVPPNAAAIAAVLEMTESTLDRESARWLALHNFSLADDKYLKDF